MIYLPYCMKHWKKTDIFAMIMVLLEVFGVDFPDAEYDSTVFKALLTKALNEGKKSGAKNFCFFTDQNSHPDSLELGFHPVGEYVCYWKKI